MDRHGSIKSALEDVFGDLSSGTLTETAKPCEAQAGGGVDFSDEDAEIAALMAGLEKEHARLHELDQQLRGRSTESFSDAKVWEDKRLLVPPPVPCFGQDIASITNADEIRETADSSGSDIETCGSRQLTNRHVGTGRGLIGIKKNTSEDDSEAWASHCKLLSSLTSSNSRKLIEPLKRKALAGKILRTDALASVPIRLLPDAAVFQDCKVGGSYQVQVEIQNLSNAGLDLKILPCTNRVFTSGPLHYNSATRKKLGVPKGLIPPNISVYLNVNFSPKSLDDQSDQLVIVTDAGNLSLPVRASGVQPPPLRAM